MFSEYFYLNSYNNQYYEAIMRQMDMPLTLILVICRICMP